MRTPKFPDTFLSGRTVVLDNIKPHLRRRITLQRGSVKQICWAVLTVSFQGSHQKVMLNKYKLLKNAFVSLLIKSRIKGDTKHTAPFSAPHLETLFDYVFPEDIGQCNGDQLNHANHLANHFFGLLRATEADC